MPRVPGCDAVYEIANQWRERCLKSDGSLLWPGSNLWDDATLGQLSETLRESKSPDESDDFFVRTANRLDTFGEPSLRLFAEVTVIWSLPLAIYSPSRKFGWLESIVDPFILESSPLIKLLEAAFHSSVNLGEGVRSRHAYRRGYQINAILSFARLAKSKSVSLNDYQACKSCINEAISATPASRDVDNIVLHLLFPDEHEAITSSKTKQEIARNYPDLEVPDDIDATLKAIRQHLVQIGFSENFSFYDPEVQQLWNRNESAVPRDSETSFSNKPDLDNETDSILTSFSSLSSLASQTISSIESLIRTKKQIIFEGPPGSGKTYVARLFARYLAGVPLDTDADEHVEIVQFHQSYGYEDFVAGIRPVTGENGQLTYETRPGVFLEMCRRALENPDETYVLIIDEINRGNLSRIFGELLYGLEYRDQPVRMQYPVEVDGQPSQHLTIPGNLYLIGTMNSTDRSLAMIDYALRRRFYFWRLMPTENGTAPVLQRWLERQEGISAADRGQLLATFVELNAKIARVLGPDYQIGHSYFMLNDGQIADPSAREQVWRYAIEPLLREYFHTRHDADAHIAKMASGFVATPLDDIIGLNNDLEA